MIDLVDNNLLARVGTVIVPTPAECIAGIDEMLRAAKQHNLDIIDIASPLGPDSDEAIAPLHRLLTKSRLRRG